MKRFIKGCVTFCAVMVLLLSACAEVVIDHNSAVTVTVTAAVPGEWVSLLAMAGENENYNISEDNVLYASQFQADNSGSVSVSFLCADLPACVFLAGGAFTDGAASPKNLGAYTPASSGMILPGALQTIGEEAFMDCPFQCVVVGQAVTRIEGKAFKNCKSLKRIDIPTGVVDIAEDAFEGCGALTIGCASGSAACEFAKTHGFTVKLLN